MAAAYEQADNEPFIFPEAKGASKSSKSTVANNQTFNQFLTIPLPNQKVPASTKKTYLF